MSSSSTPWAPEVRAFLEASAPAGSAALNLTRFRKHTGASRVDAVMDDLLGGEGDGTRAPFGLTLQWVDGQGRALRTLTLHPLPAEVEDELLPACVVAASALGLPVQLVARHAALLSTPAVVDTLVPITEQPPAGARGGYRAGLPAPPDAALRSLLEAGFQVVDPSPRGFHMVREQRRKKRPLWLFMLVPIVLFGPALAVLARSFTAVFTMVRQVFERALRDRTERLRYEVCDGTLTVTAESHPGERLQRVVALGELLSVGFGPASTPTLDSDRGVLRALTREGCVRLVHDFAAAPARARPGKSAADVELERARMEGRALRGVLEWLAAAHRS